MIGIVVVVAIELSDRQVGRNANAGFEGSQCDIVLLRKAFFRWFLGQKRNHAPEGFGIRLGRIEHALAPLDPW